MLLMCVWFCAAGKHHRSFSPVVSPTRLGPGVWGEETSPFKVEQGSSRKIRIHFRGRRWRGSL